MWVPSKRARAKDWGQGQVGGSCTTGRHTLYGSGKGVWAPRPSPPLPLRRMRKGQVLVSDITSVFNTLAYSCTRLFVELSW
uniref:Uncharacterized protein n=1 Tax=Physcomitrium patens TaxID=3218 RepID=A0A2K1IZZ8_PHYPA|nr:hypothetical protein PHYPA_022737 [Physcomitrium patens]